MRTFAYACRVIPFPATRRSVLERIQSDDREVRRVAFGDLAEGYWRPSYHYVRLHWRLPAASAEDVVQSFFTAAFEKQYVERYDPAKAKFRTFLRTCLDRFVQNHQKAERAEKRGGGQVHVPLDFPAAERELAAIAVQDRRDLDRFFHDETVRDLFARTVDAMRRTYEAEGKQIVFQVFERHDLRPSPDLTYTTVAREFDLTTAQVTNYLHAARRRFREQALVNLRALVGTDEEFRDEARELFGLEIA
jgi:DNA-directed RNA polymerase specialized sigma24 family protein